jgi:hypothetical protein
MAADLWLPGAQRLPLSDAAPCDTAYPPKAIAHITWDKNATKANPQALVPFESLRSYFSAGGAAVAPHILWDPFTGRFAQYYPATSRSKSVADATGGTRTNRAGRVVVQVEALFFPWCVVAGTAYEHLTDTPCKGWPELHAWIKSWGVPDVWPMGRPTTFDSRRSESVWEKQGGWYGHSQVPENDHQDPGTWPAFITEETDVALTNAEIDAIALRVWAFRNTTAGDKHDMHQALVSAEADSAQALAQSRANGSGLSALSGRVSNLAVGGVDLDALAAKVADLLAARLRD